MSPSQAISLDFKPLLEPVTTSITDTGKGRASVTSDIEAVVSKIEYWYRGSIAPFKILYRDEHRVWGVRTDRTRSHPSFGGRLLVNVCGRVSSILGFSKKCPRVLTPLPAKEFSLKRTDTSRSWAGWGLNAADLAI